MAMSWAISRVKAHQEVLECVIDELIAEARSQGTLNETPLHFALEKDKRASGALSFPGKVLAHAPSQRLFIADSNNNRIVIADLDGHVLDIAGSGALGKTDGDFNVATFHHSQDMALCSPCWRALTERIVLWYSGGY